MTVSAHAKERAFERYGVRFSKKRWESFERTVRNPKFAIRLQGERLACYFEKQWFLVICKENGAVLTFLNPEDASEEERQFLRNDERYLRSNNDTFRVLERNSASSMGIGDIRPTERSKERPVGLPSTLAENELPPEVLESAEKLMKKLCKDDTKPTR